MVCKFSKVHLTGLVDSDIVLTGCLWTFEHCGHLLMVYFGRVILDCARKTTEILPIFMNFCSPQLSLVL